MSLALTYTRRQLVEMLRTPVMLITLALTPVTVMLFFLVPFLGHDPFAMTSATGTMVVFAVLLGCIGHFATTISATRESAWGSYLRTLPGGLAPQVAAHLTTGLAVVAAAIIPIVVVAALFTAASATAPQIALATLAVLGTVLTFTLMGLAIGYLFSSRATIIITSVAILPLAVGGGMFFDPQETPALVETIAPFLPTRGAGDLVLWALTDVAPNPMALVLLAVWTAIFAGLVVWGYRRDEVRRFN
ncbi:MAG TPA: ABC transporter permease [Beutenbergiaceae bacterium]|nr:ABC transporter permease [Beutenbergiaceae bacterium]